MSDSLGAAEVLLNDEVIADLDRFEDERYRLTFREAYKALPTLQRVPLGLFYEDRGLYPVATESFPAWFANLLPQSSLRASVARSIGAGVHDHWEILLALGDDLPGAVRVRARDVTAPRTPRATFEPPQPVAGLRSSLAGIQPKLSLRDLHDRRLVLPLHDIASDDAVIAKLPDPRYPTIVRVEHATTRWARLSGVRVPETSLRRLEDVQGLPPGFPASGPADIFVTRRFDRSAQGRIHMEDFAQVFDRPPGDDQYRGSYEAVGAVIHETCGPDAFVRFVEQLAFCIVCGNTDAHLKNFSLLYPPRRSAAERRFIADLSPGYDLVASIVLGEKPTLALTFYGAKEISAIDLSFFARLAAALGVALDVVERKIRGIVERAVASLPQVSEFTDSERNQLHAHIAGLKLKA